MLKDSYLGTALMLLAAGSLTLLAPATTAESAVATFDATHEIVCECTCGGETQTYKWIHNYSCSRFDGISCEYGEGSTSTLEGCEKKAQPKTTASSVESHSPAPSSTPSRAPLGQRTLFNKP